MKKLPQKNGYIALMSSIIIALILLGLAFSVSSSGYFYRFNVLNNEFKRVGLGLAESCVNSALLKMAQNYTYAPAVGGDIVPVGSQTCNIKSVTYGPEDPVTHQKTATIETQAQYRGSFSNMDIHATVRNPTIAPIVPPPPNITIGAWNEASTSP